MTMFRMVDQAKEKGMTKNPITTVTTMITITTTMIMMITLTATTILTLGKQQRTITI